MNRLILCAIALALHCITAYSQQFVEPKWTTAYGYRRSIINHDCTKIISCEGHIVSVIDAKTSAVISSHCLFFGQSVDYPVLSESGDKIAIIDESSHIWIWSTGSGELLTFCADGMDISRVRTATFNDDENRFLVINNDHTADIWDVETGNRILKIGNKHEKVLTAKWLDNNYLENKYGDKIVTCDTSGVAKVWDVNSGTVLYTLTGDYLYANSVEFSTDGKKLIVNGFRFVRVIETESGKEIFSTNDAGWFSGRFNGKGNRVFISGISQTGTAKILVYDCDEKRVRNILSYYPYTDYIKPNYEGDKVAIQGIYNEKSITVRDVETDKALSKILTDNTSFCFLGKTDSLIIVKEGIYTHIWDIRTKKKTRSGYWANGKIVLDKSGKYMFFHDSIYEMGAADVETGKLLWSLPVSTIPVNTVSVTSNNRLVLPSQKRYLELRAPNGDSIAKTEENKFDPFAIVAYNKKNAFIAFFEGDSLREWDNEGNLLKSKWCKNARFSSSDKVVIAPDDKKLLLVKGGSLVSVYDTEKWEVVGMIDSASQGVGKCFFSENGKYIVSVSPVEIVVWSSENGNLILRQPGISATINPQENRLAIANYDSVTVWDLDKKVQVNTLKGHVEEVLCVSYDHTGNRLVTGCYDNEIRLWNANSGRTIAILTGNYTFIRDVIFDKNNRFVFSIDNNGVTKVYDISGIISETEDDRESVAQTGFDIDVFLIDDMLNITLKNSFPYDQLFTIYNAMGLSVASGTIHQGVIQTKYEIGNLPNGLFFLSVGSKGNTAQKKFLKIKK